MFFSPQVGWKAVNRTWSLTGKPVPAPDKTDRRGKRYGMQVWSPVQADEPGPDPFAATESFSSSSIPKLTTPVVTATRRRLYHCDSKMTTGRNFFSLRSWLTANIHFFLINWKSEFQEVPLRKWDGKFTYKASGCVNAKD